MEDRKLNQDFVPLLTIMSTDFEKDLDIVKRVLGDFEQRTHSENGFKFSGRAEMAAGWWFYDVLVSREFLQNLFRILMPEGIGGQEICITKASRGISRADEQVRVRGTGKDAWRNPIRSSLVGMADEVEPSGLKWA
jgi:hypothetical protein